MKTVLLPLLGILLLAGCEKEAATPVAAGEDSPLDLRATEKLTVCHNTGRETIPYEMIEIAEPAYERAHLDHGDARPGELIPDMPGYRFGCNCEVEPEETTCMPDGKTWTAVNLTLEPEGYNEGEDFWWYGNDEATYAEYGRLYTWAAANQACQDYGDGWRLPTKADWDALIRVYDGDWPSVDPASSVPAFASLTGNNSSSGFDARLGGGRFMFTSGPEFAYLEEYGHYWSSTQYVPSPNSYVSYYFGDEFQDVSRGHNRGVEGFSCRCVKD